MYHHFQGGDNLKVDDKDFFIFLFLVKKNGNLSLMVSEEITYSRISEILNYALENDYVQRKHNKLIITEKGLKFISMKGKVKNNKFHIISQLNYKIEKKDIFDIYIPYK